MVREPSVQAARDLGTSVRVEVVVVPGGLDQVAGLRTITLFREQVGEDAITRFRVAR